MSHFAGACSTFHPRHSIDLYVIFQESIQSLQFTQNGNLRPSVANSVLCNRILQGAYYLQVNALSERIIRIYLHEFTNNERENSIPHEAAECGIENFEFIVSERVQVNPDNSRAMSALTFLLFKLNTLQTKIVKL